MTTPYSNPGLAHPLTRRVALQAGGISLLGLGSSHLNALRAEQTESAPARSVIFIFLSGGLGQHDSFDMKPDAPEEIRGEFKPIACRTPGLSICEHLPKLAERSEHWSLVRSLTHSTNDHSAGHMLMLSGRNQLPPGFNSSTPKDSDWPSIASVVSAVTKPRHNLPPAVALPERLIHFSGRVIPGQFGGMMGRTRDPWFLEASHYEPRAYGAFPQYEFDHQRRDYKAKRETFEIPDLNLPQGVNAERFQSRLDILKNIDQQVRTLESGADKAGLDRFRQAAVSLLSSANVRKAFDLRHQPIKDIERYGNHSFGWSLLMAARLVEAGVNMVQVNLGNNETWDTHGNAFPHLKEKLFPPTDQAVSALLDDLHARGLLESTLVVMAGEFGRTPKISHLAQHYKLPGRDHWGAAQTVFFAGGGTGGGKVIGATDRKGAYPISEPQTPENFAATIYHALGVPSSTMWSDAESRPHHVYYGEPIRGLVG
jgi:hypothetical protein